MKNLIWLLLLFSAFAQGQQVSISGVVSDQNNGETLIGATVYVQGTDIGTTTNEYGFYSLTMDAGNYTIVYSYVGYESIEKQVQLSGNTKINVELSDGALEIEEVVVVAENNKKVDVKTPQMSVNKLSAQTIKQIPAVMGEVDVIKSLQLLPGVSNAGEGASGFNVRGGAEDQNLVLLDEAIIYNSSHLFGFFSIFNTDAIKNLKLYKGGIPAKYGGRASSVLEIIQRDGNKKNFAMTGGIGAISSRLTLETPFANEKGSILLAGRASYANLFLAIANNDNRAGFYDLNLKGNYTLNENNRLFISGYYGQDNFEFSDIFKNNYGNVSGSLRWNHIFRDNIFANMSLIYSKYNYGFELDFIGLDWVSNIQNYNLKYDLAYFYSDRLKMHYGLSSIYYDFNPGEIKPTDETSLINESILDRKYAFESAAYVNLEHKITDRLTAQYGMRYSMFNRMGGEEVNLYQDDLPLVYNKDLDIYERTEPIGTKKYSGGEVIKTYGNLEPRLALSYQVFDEASIKASYNRMAQYLHLISNTTSATPLDVWTPSGTYIEPQIADQYAVGYFTNVLNSDYSLESEVYYKTIDNRVDYIDGADLIAQNDLEREILIGEARSYGLELLLRKNQGKLTGWLAYTLSKSEQRTPGNKSGGQGLNNGDWYNTSYDRTHDVSLTANYSLTKKWSFGANFAFQTGRPVTYPNGQFIYDGLSIATYSERNANRLPAYHRLDVSATYRPSANKKKSFKGEWVFSIYNVYNRRNAASISFAQNEDTAVNEATRTAIFGIIPSITYNFKFR